MKVIILFFQMFTIADWMLLIAVIILAIWYGWQLYKQAQEQRRIKNSFGIKRLTDAQKATIYMRAGRKR